MKMDVKPAMVVFGRSMVYLNSGTSCDSKLHAPKRAEAEAQGDGVAKTPIEQRGQEVRTL